MDAELVPQGTLAERIRIAAFGIGGFYTPTSVGTELAEGKEHREINGRTYVLEHPLPADYALIRAWKADKFGNLQFRLSQRNFNPIMAMAASITIVEVENDVLEIGELDPDQVHVLRHIRQPHRQDSRRRHLVRRQAGAVTSSLSHRKRVGARPSPKAMERQWSLRSIENDRQGKADPPSYVRPAGDGVPGWLDCQLGRGNAHSLAPTTLTRPSHSSISPRTASSAMGRWPSRDKKTAIWVNAGGQHVDGPAGHGYRSPCRFLRNHPRRHD